MDCCDVVLSLGGRIAREIWRFPETRGSAREVAEHTQRSNAKIQRHFRSSSPRTLQEFEEKTCKTSVGKCYKNSTVRENYKLGVSEDVH